MPAILNLNNEVRHAILLFNYVTILTPDLLNPSVVFWNIRENDRNDQKDSL